MSVCGAKKRDGQPCQSSPVKGAKRCRLHGGATPAGPASPHWIHGRRSRFLALLPERYREGFDLAIDDPQLVSVRRQLAMLDVREEELIQRIGSGESGEAWRQAKLALAELRGAVAKKDPRAMQIALQQLGATIDAGAYDEATHGDLQDLYMTRARLSAQETALMRAAGEYMERKAVNAIVLRAIDIMRSAVEAHAEHDLGRRILAATVTGIRGLLEPGREAA